MTKSRIQAEVVGRPICGWDRMQVWEDVDLLGCRWAGM